MCQKSLPANSFLFQPHPWSGNVTVKADEIKMTQKDAEPIVERYLTIELWAAFGPAMLLQGNMTSYHLWELISVSNVQP